MKVNVTTLEIYGVGKGNLRLTELGAVALTNGAKILVPIELAQHLLLTHQSHVRLLSGSFNSIPYEAVEKDKGWRGEILSGKAPSPVDTSEKKGPAEASKIAKATNRSMAGKGQTKAEPAKT